MSRILEELQGQADQFNARQNQINQRISNFDLEKEMYNGMSSAYKIGKTQLGQMIGQQRTNEIIEATPLLGSLAKYGSARSGLTDAIRSRYNAFRGNTVGDTAENMLGEGKSISQKLQDVVGDSDEFLSGLGNTARGLARDGADLGSDLDGFTTRGFSQMGGGIEQQVRQLGGRAYAQLSTAQRNALPKTTVDESGIPYNKDLISPSDVRKGLTTGRFGYDEASGKTFDTAGKLRLGDEPDLLPAPNLSLPGGGRIDSRFVGERGFLNPRFTADPESATAETGGRADDYFSSTSGVREGASGSLPEDTLEGKFGERFNPSMGRNLEDIFTKDREELPSRPEGDPFSTQQVSRVEPQANIEARQLRTQQFQDLDKPPTLEQAPESLPSLSSLTQQPSAQARIQRLQSIRAKGKNPARQQQQDESGEADLQPSAQARQLEDPLETQGGQQFERSAMPSERPNAPYGESVETAPRQV